MNDPLKDINTIQKKLSNGLAKRKSLAMRYKIYYRLVLILLILILVGGFSYYFINSRSIPIPKNIRHEAKFAILYPEPTKNVTYQKTSFKYDSSIGTISFIINFDNRNITFTEQSTPEVFNATSTFFTKFTQRLANYATLNTTDGQVVLTLPPQTKEETAIMNTKGTLLFASLKGDLSETNWTLLFNTLQSVQPQV